MHPSCTVRYVYPIIFRLSMITLTLMFSPNVMRGIRHSSFFSTMTLTNDPLQKVRAAVADSNYHQFFQLQDMAPNMGNYLMDKLIPSVRQGALQRICKAYRPSVSVSFVLQELGFDIKRKKEVKGAMTWMTNCGCIFEDGMLLTKDTTLKVGESVGGKNSLI